MHENDHKQIRFAVKKFSEVLRAAGAEEVAHESRFAHLVGGARMGHDASISVVDGFCRTHDVANLFVCDGSVFPTQGSGNPGLTIQAIAARTADYLIAQGDAIFHPGAISRVAGPMRRDLAPPATFGHGVPRV